VPCRRTTAVRRNAASVASSFANVTTFTVLQPKFSFGDLNTLLVQCGTSSDISNSSGISKALV
jgi:hypothetical protein